MNQKVTNIFEFAQGAINLIADKGLSEAYSIVTKYMDAIEELGVLTGAEKLKWVLAKLAEGIVNFDAWRERIVNFITNIKAAYNQAKVLFA
jgi:hypothetical protein